MLQCCMFHIAAKKNKKKSHQEQTFNNERRQRTNGRTKLLCFNLKQERAPVGTTSHAHVKTWESDHRRLECRSLTVLECFKQKEFETKTRLSLQHQNPSSDISVTLSTRRLPLRGACCMSSTKALGPVVHIFNLHPSCGEVQARAQMKLVCYDIPK